MLERWALDRAQDDGQPVDVGWHRFRRGANRKGDEGSLAPSVFNVIE